MGQIVADGSACGEAVISPLELQEGSRAVPANSKALCETMNWTLVPSLRLRVPSEIRKVEVQT